MSDKTKLDALELIGVLAGFFGPIAPRKDAKTGEEYWIEGPVKFVPLGWRSKRQPNEFVMWLLIRAAKDSLAADQGSLLSSLEEQVGSAPFAPYLPIESRLSPEDKQRVGGVFPVTEFKDIAAATREQRDLDAADEKVDATRKKWNQLLASSGAADDKKKVLKLFDIEHDVYARTVKMSMGPGFDECLGLVLQYRSDLYEKGGHRPGSHGSFRLAIEAFIPLIQVGTMKSSGLPADTWVPVTKVNATIAASIIRLGGASLSLSTDAEFSGVRAFTSVRLSDKSARPAKTRFAFREALKAPNPSVSDRELATKWKDSTWPEVRERLNQVCAEEPLKLLLESPVVPVINIFDGDRSFSFLQKLGSPLSTLKATYHKDNAQLARDSQGYSDATDHVKGGSTQTSLEELRNKRPKNEQKPLIYLGSSGTTIKGLLTDAGIFDAKDKKFTGESATLNQVLSSAVEVADGVPLYLDTATGSRTHTSGLILSLALRADPTERNSADRDYLLGLRLGLRNQLFGLSKPKEEGYEYDQDGYIRTPSWEPPPNELMKALQIDWLPGEDDNDNWLKRLWPAGSGATPRAGVAVFPMRGTIPSGANAQAKIGFGFRGEVVSLGVDLYRESPTEREERVQNDLAKSAGDQGIKDAIRKPAVVPDSVMPSTVKPEKKNLSELTPPLFALGSFKVQRAGIRVAAGYSTNGQLYFGGALMLDGIRWSETDDIPKEEEDVAVSGLSIGVLAVPQGDRTVVYFDPETWRNGVRGKPLWLPGPWSPRTVLEKLSILSKSTDGKRTWRDDALDVLRIDRIGITLDGFDAGKDGGTPGSRLSIIGNVSLNLGTKVSFSVVGLSVGFRSPERLSTSMSTGLSFDWSITGAALAIHVPKVFKLNAAFTYESKPPAGEDTKKLAVATFSGLGKIVLVEKFALSILVHLEASRENATAALGIPEFFPNLTGGFGFMCATGLPFTFGVFKLTGIGGGYGHDVVLVLPDKPSEVPEYPIIKLLTGSAPRPPGAAPTKPGDATSTTDSTPVNSGETASATTLTRPEKTGEAEKLLEDLATFKSKLQTKKDARCYAIALTFQLVEKIDCVALVVIESRKPGFDFTLLGMADFYLGPKPKPEDAKEAKALGHIQLSLLVRYSSDDPLFKIMGAITGESWFFHPDCKLGGAFALCIWKGGPHDGDFMFSLGGYSPLVPKKAHYPALERVSLNWNVTSALNIFAESYLFFDNNSVALGMKGGMKYVASRLKADASFSFDAYLQFYPLYYEVVARIGIHVEFKCLTTIRLSLDVELHAWGQPFGGRLYVSLEVGWFTFNTSIEVGASHEKAREALSGVSFDELTATLRGKEPSILSLSSPDLELTSVSLDARKPRYSARRPARSDGLKLCVDLKVPARTVTMAGKNPKVMTDTMDVRPTKWHDIDSTLDVRVTAAGSTVPLAGDWVIDYDAKQAESRWVITARPADELPKRMLVAGVTVRPADGGGSGTRFDGLGVKRLDPVPITREEVATTVTGTTPPPRAATPGEVDPGILASRAEILKALVDAGFDLQDSKATATFRPLEARPMVARAA